MMEFLNNIQFEQAQWLAAIPVVAILLAPFISACGKKAPPRPSTEKSGEQNIKS